MRRIEEEELERRNKRLFGTNAKEASLSIQTWKGIFRGLAREDRITRWLRKFFPFSGRNSWDTVKYPSGDFYRDCTRLEILSKISDSDNFALGIPPPPPLKPTTPFFPSLFNRPPSKPSKTPREGKLCDRSTTTKYGVSITGEKLNALKTWWNSVNYNPPPPPFIPTSFGIPT